MTITEIAQAMYTKYVRAKAKDTRSLISEYQHWHQLMTHEQLGWIAAAEEAVAQVAAMNATAPSTALGAPE